MGFSLVEASRGYALVAVCELLFVVASLVAEHGFHGRGFQSLRPWGSVVESPGL